MIVMQTDLTHSQTIPGSCVCFVIIDELSKFQGGPLVITLMKELHRRLKQVSNYVSLLSCSEGVPYQNDSWGYVKDKYLAVLSVNSGDSYVYIAGYFSKNRAGWR